MRKEMKQWLMVSILLINAISIVACLQVNDVEKDFIVVEHRRCSSDVSSSDFEGSSNGASQSSSGLSTPVLQSRKKECSFVFSDDNPSECGTRAPSDCSTRFTESCSECGTRAPSDCGTKISDSDQLALRVISAIRSRESLTRFVGSQGNLAEFFDENGNAISYDPDTPLTARADNSPLKASARKCFMHSSPRRF